MEKQQEELREMMQALEKDKEMEASEKQKLEEEILAKAQEVEKMQQSVEEKEQEAIRLQEEINEANLQMQVRMRSGFIHNNTVAKYLRITDKLRNGYDLLF